MSEAEKILSYIKQYFLGLLIFIFPLFFLTTTQEMFLTSKLYLIGFAAVFLLFISIVEMLVTKKITWQKSFFDNILILLLVSVAISTLITSPNKIQALLNPNFGLMTFLSLTILYFFLSRQKTGPSVTYSVKSSVLILSLLTIIFYFAPLKNINLPQTFQFLKANTFTPLGDRLDLAVFFGFLIVCELGLLLKKTNKVIPVNLFLWCISLIALTITTYSLIKLPIQLPPLKLSLLAVVHILKNPLTFFLGAGVDNFSAVFTLVKDIGYNQSPFWQVSSFTVSRSAFLHILTETGVLGLFSFGLLTAGLIGYVFGKSENVTFKLAAIYLIFIFFIFPPSLTTWFLLYILLAEISKDQPSNTTSLDLSEMPQAYYGVGIFSLVTIMILGYLITRSYAAEYFFKKGLNGFIVNRTQDVYENQRKAIIYNPFIEKFRINFSQVNLLIANNIAQKNQSSKNTTKLSEQDRQNIAQGIQTAISEAKTAVSLNPQKAVNWGNLAVIYRNIINIAKGADLWTISSYQRAIAADPKNPNYQLGLGGIYYALGNWEEAGKVFEQTVILKPNWPNAYYNLAWTSYQKKDYQKAISYMENAIRLINPVTNKVDYDKAKDELEIFKLKLAGEDKIPASNSPQLSLPLPFPTNTSKIKLPAEVSP